MYANESLPYFIFFNGGYNPLTTSLLTWSKSKTAVNFNYSYGGKTYGALSTTDYYSEVGYFNFDSYSVIPSSYKDAIAITIRNTSYMDYPDLWLNAKKPWGVGYAGNNITYPWYDYEGILTHELGHVLGLGDITNPYYVTSTMYQYFLLKPNNSTSYNSRTLETDDLTGLRKLYP